MITATEHEIPQTPTTTLSNKWKIIIECDTYAEKLWVVKQLRRGIKYTAKE